jgi:hypothetical protein
LLVVAIFLTAPFLRNALTKASSGDQSLAIRRALEILLRAVADNIQGVTTC